MSDEFLREVWIVYCEERLGRPLDETEPQAIAPWRGIELLWRFNGMFSERSEMLKSVEFDERFDPHADGALCQMAKDDGFAAWDRLNAGGWRILYERHIYALTVMAANAASREPVISHLPAELDDERLARALWLQFLLGGARRIDRRLVPKSMPGDIPRLPGEASLKPH